MADYTPEDAIGLLRSYLKHRDYVRLGLMIVRQSFERRAQEHDTSKMSDDEFAGFARINAIARTLKFGTPEYAASIEAERATVDLHYLRNTHHPERPRLMGLAAEANRGLPDDYTYWLAHGAAAMTWIDITEMVCDWWGARLGYADNRSSWMEAVGQMLEHKGKYLQTWQIELVKQVAKTLADAEPTKAAGPPAP